MRRPGLLMLDFIDDTVNADGSYDRKGYAESVAKRGVLKQAALALEMAREREIPVIHVVVGFSDGYPQCPIDTLTLAGVSTDMVILATAQDGHDRHYAVEVLEDATAADKREMQSAALTVISRTARTTTVVEALDLADTR